jgi:hypothetical protein
MDKYGLLTIKFSSPISIPSYLLRELDQSLNRSKGSSRRLDEFITDVFFTADRYEQNIKENWSSKIPKPESLKVTGFKPNLDQSERNEFIDEETEYDEDAYQNMMEENIEASQ